MKSYVNLRHVVEFFLESEMFQSCTENQNTHFRSITFIQKLCCLRDNVENYGTDKEKHR